MIAEEDTSVKICTFDETWLRFSDKNCVIFSSENTLKFPEVMYWHSDGTFNSSSDHFLKHFILNPGGTQISVTRGK